MFTFTHTYANNDIKFTIDMLGSEALYVNDKLVSHSNNWKLKNTHNFSVDGQPLVLQIKVNSVMTCEYEVTIFENDQIIFNQTQLFHFSTDGKEVSFNQEELRWKKEIEFPNDILSLAWLFYFIMIAAAVVNSFTQSIFTENATAIIIALTITYGMYKVGSSIFKGLKTS